MKKILSVLLAVSVLASLTACETMTESASSSSQQDIASQFFGGVEQWSNNYLDGAEELHITTQQLTEENIAVLGYSKPDVPVSQPAG